MPIILMFIGIVFILSGVKGTEGDVLNEFKTSLIGNPEVANEPGFWKWAVAMFVIGATGYYKPIRPVTISFLILIFVVLMLNSNSKFASTIESELNKLNPNNTS